MTGDTITGLAGGIYYVTVQDANGCISAGNVIVQEPTQLTSVISSTTHNLCNGQCMGTASVLAGGGTPPYTYTWLGIGQSGQSATNLCAGTYNVVVSDQRGCTSTNVAIINEPSQIQIQGTVTNVLCNNTTTGLISITVSGGTPVYQYVWLPPANSTTSVAANLGAGTYTVVVTDSWNCSNTASFTVTQPLPLQAYISTDPARCGLNNGTATIDSVTGGTPAYSFLWSPGNMNTSHVTDLTSGIYNVIITDANNCTLVQQVPIGQVQGPDLIQFTKTDALCYGYFDGTATAMPVGGQSPYQYMWNNGQNTATAVNLGAGTYTVTVTDANGCTKAGVVQINQPNPIVPIANGSDTICIGNFSVNITANATGGTPPYSFLWSGPGLTNPSAQVQLVSPDSTTNYYVNVYDANGCASANPASVTIFVYPPISASISNDVIICKGDIYSINVTAQGGKPPYTYVWNNGVGNPNIVSPTNTFTYIVSVYDACGTPPAVDSMTITVKDPPHIIRDPRFQKGCVPLGANFDCIIDPSSYPVTYLWNFGDPSSGVLNLSNDSTPSHTYNIPGNYSVTLTVTSSFGCQTVVTYHNLVQVSPYPQVDFTYSPTSNITPINGDVWFAAQTDPSNILTWIFGDGYTASGVMNPMHTYTQAGVYTIMLIARNADGCMDTAVHMLRVNDIFTLWAPSAFSPGSGKANGYWYPRGLGIDSSDYYLAIYDRWGQIVFETREMPKGTNLSPSEVMTISVADNEWEPGGWNGGYMNDMTKIVPVGSYIWYVRVKEKDTGYLHERKGIVTVIR